MESVLRQILHFGLLGVIMAAIVWAMVGPEQAGIYHNPLAVIGLGLIGLGLCRSERDRLNGSRGDAPRRAAGAILPRRRAGTGG